MGVSVYWEPSERKKKCIVDYRLAKALEDLRTLDIHDVFYLRGFRDAGIEEAQELIDAIEKYGSLDISKQY